MKPTSFVCASAGLFASWLTVTYLRPVPSELYPTLGKGSVPISAKNESSRDSSKPLLSLEEKKAKPLVEAKK
ncbi:MAG TPA: hypothetical protein VIM57_09035 [Luteolibacter sp.]